MNGLYAEAGVRCKQTPKVMLIKFLLIFAIVASMAVVPLVSQIFVFLPALFVILAFYAFPKLNVEYEYVFCDGQFDFDKIMGNAKRKTMMKIDFEKIEIVAPLGSHALDEYKNKQLKVKNFTSYQKEIKPYAIIGRDDKNNLVEILFEPSSKMLDCMRSKAPRKVVMY